jgi:hypothetical protein
MNDMNDMKDMKGMNERRNKRTNKSLLHWATHSLSQLFSKLPLHWATASLRHPFAELPRSYFFFELPFIWATSSLTRFCSERAWNHQLKYRIPLEWQHVQKLPLPRMFSAANPWQTHLLPDCYCDLLLHLPTTWWWGWHDGSKTNHDHSSVFP